MNNAPFDRDDARRENERAWDQWDKRERALRFGDGDYVAKPREDIEELRKQKEIEKLWRHEEWGKRT